MIGYIRGSVVFLAAEHVIVDTNGIGYRVFMTGSSLAKLEKSQEVKMHVYTNVREDAIQLYGFLDYDEYNIFLKLITINGIGPKVALGILSAIAPDNFRLAVLNQDIKAMTKLPGVGKKTAERLLLELRDKLGFSSEEKAQTMQSDFIGNSTGSAYDEALQALLALGYDKSEILPMLKQYAKENMTVEAMIKAVLKGFAGR